MKHIVKEYYNLLFALAFVVLIVVVFKFFLMMNYVPSSSMEPTIVENSLLLSVRGSYHETEPKRGDIIVFKYPLNEKVLQVKRIIGLPGEHVSIVNGKIYVNGNTQPINEEYIVQKWNKHNNGFDYNIPKDCYLVLGDNRNSSVDARDWSRMSLEEHIADTVTEAESYSYVKRNNIVAKVELCLYPKIKNTK